MKTAIFKTPASFPSTSARTFLTFPLPPSCPPTRYMLSAKVNLEPQTKRLEPNQGPVREYPGEEQRQEVWPGTSFPRNSLRLTAAEIASWKFNGRGQELASAVCDCKDAGWKPSTPVRLVNHRIPLEQRSERSEANVLRMEKRFLMADLETHFFMPPANLDALLNDLDATLNELQMEDAAQKRQEQMLKQQQEQLRLQQQLIEVQTALLKQQQINAVSAAAVPPAMDFPISVTRSSPNSPPIPYSQYSSAQVQREQLMQYNQGVMRSHSHHSEPDFLSSDVQSVMPPSVMSAPGAGGGVFGSRVVDTESVTSSEKKRTLFGFGSTKSVSSTKKKQDVLATLESVGF
ncbi:hypothetical protein BC830DRAFT_1218018 [Chytriomyces sp. MP71]|nr:hypothetical protein BC830DRAFT_1218018 [Chytriomyces sp. MP71]